MDKCPFCNSERIGCSDQHCLSFACGTESRLVASGDLFSKEEIDSWLSKHLKRDATCYKTQLAALTAEVAELQYQLETERLAHKSLSEHLEAHEGDLKEEVKELRGLVREMGRTIIALPADTREIWNAANELLDRPKVKEIMKEVEGGNTR